MIVMEFCSIFLLANGISSLILALIICVSGSIRTIAMIKNPPSLNFKPIERIMRVVFILCFLAGTTLLPYFGVTEILRGANSECPDRLPTFVAISTDFLIGGKLWLQLLMQIERFAAFFYPHFHRIRFTKRATTILSLVLVVISLLSSLLVLTGIKERHFYGVFINVFGTCSWIAMFTLIWLTYGKLKHRRSRIGVNDINQQPRMRERIEYERVTNALGARKYLFQSVLWSSPSILFILPWYIVLSIYILCDVCLATNAGFFWQRFWVPFSFLYDAWMLLFMIFTGP